MQPQYNEYDYAWFLGQYVLSLTNCQLEHLFLARRVSMQL